MAKDKLSLEQAARLLGVPAATMERWLRQGKIPFPGPGKRPVFIKSALLSWAKTHNLLHQATAPANGQDPSSLSLADCLQKGGATYDLAGANVKSILEAASRSLPLEDFKQREVFSRLWEREQLSPTGVGRGVAIPHPRHPDPDLAPSPLIFAGFLKKPMDFNAVDANPVFVLFVLLCPTTRLHLHFLSRLAFCLRNDDFVEFLEGAPALEDLISRVASLEQAMEPKGR